MKSYILKYFKNLLILSATLLSTHVFAQTINYKNYNEIKKHVSAEIKYLFRQYNSSKELHAEIFDSGDSIIKSFLESAANSNTGYLLAIQYFPKFQINNVETSSCFIFYNSKNNIFEEYRSVEYFNDEDIISYLTWHEMGHCFSHHEGFIKNSRANEFVADAFAISVAINKNKLDLPDKILKKIGDLKESDIHANHFHLNKFYTEAKESNLYSRKLTVNELLEMVYYYYEHSSLTGFEFKQK